MKNLIIDATIDTPKVEFNVREGILKINGICTPANPRNFFETIMEKLSEYQTLNKPLVIEVFLEYFNSGSSKALLNLFTISAKPAQKLTIRWIFEDDELKESGIILEEITGLKFEYIEAKN